MQKGLCVLVPCTLTYPKKSWTENTPAYGYWFKEGTSLSTGLPVATNNQSQKVHMSTKDRFQLVGSPQDYTCSLLIRDVQWEDRAKYYFRVERGTFARFDFKNYQFLLNVKGRELALGRMRWDLPSATPCFSYWEGLWGADQGTPHEVPCLGTRIVSSLYPALTQKPDIYIPEMLDPGHPVTVICVFDSHFEQCPAPTFSWMRATQPLQDIAQTTSHVSVLTLTPKPQDHGTSLTCRVNFKTGVSAENTVQLNVACEFGWGPQGDQQPWWVRRGQCGWHEWLSGVHGEEGKVGEVEAIWSSVHKHVFVTSLSLAFPKDGHTFCSPRGFSLAVANQTFFLLSQCHLTISLQMPPKTCLSAFPKPRDQVLRACGAGCGQSSLGNQEVSGECGNGVCPYSPSSVSFHPSPQA